MESKQCIKCLRSYTIDNFPEYMTRDFVFIPCNICPECKKKGRESPEHIEKKKNWLLKTNYNLTPDEKLNMVEEQENLCAICGQPETSVDKRSGKTKCLSIDHHHESGRVRGLLCGKCNAAIGLLKEDPKILESAIEYLKNR